MDAEERIRQLEAENEQLKNNMNIALQAISNLMDVSEMQDKRLSEIREKVTTLKDYAELTKRQLDNLPYEWNDRRGHFYYEYPKIESHEETIRRICEEGMSLGRFGDGEFAIMQGEPRHDFQHMDDRLAKRLLEVIKTEIPGLIVAVADNFGDVSRFNENGMRSIRAYMTDEVRDFLDEILDKDRIYADTYLTRFYATIRDNRTDAPGKRIGNLRRMWQDRDVIMVEGAQTRLGVGNDLFDNTKSIRRILAPATSSFDRYDDIFASAKRHAREGDLFLIAIGPSAAVLAYDLTREGLQGLDIGHIDMEYEWYLAGEGHRVAVPHKYNNEVIGDDDVSDIRDERYESQIVDRFD